MLSAVGCGVAGLAMRDPTPQIDAARDARASAVAAVTRAAEPEPVVEAANLDQREVALTTHAPRRPVIEEQPDAKVVKAAVAKPEVVDPKVARHHAWCDNRYRTYEVKTATFRPYVGKPRTLCRSPIMPQGLRAG